jgi:hypothetical protein
VPLLVTMVEVQDHKVQVGAAAAQRTFVFPHTVLLTELPLRVEVGDQRRAAAQQLHAVATPDFPVALREPPVAASRVVGEARRRRAGRKQLVRVLQPARALSVRAAMAAQEIPMARVVVEGIMAGAVRPKAEPVGAPAIPCTR